MWKAFIMACFEVFTQHLFGGAEENHKRNLTWMSIFWVEIRIQALLIYSISAHHCDNWSQPTANFGTISLHPGLYHYSFGGHIQWDIASWWIPNNFVLSVTASNLVNWLCYKFSNEQEWKGVIHTRIHSFYMCFLHFCILNAPDIKYIPYHTYTILCNITISIVHISIALDCMQCENMNICFQL
jgi:hypothetical protein